MITIDFPLKFEIFGRIILAHPVFETVGIFLAMRFYYYLKRKSPEKMPLSHSLIILIGATAGALIGSKLIGNLENRLCFSAKSFHSLDFGLVIPLLGD